MMIPAALLSSIRLLVRQVRLGDSAPADHSGVAVPLGSTVGTTGLQRQESSPGTCSGIASRTSRSPST